VDRSVFWRGVAIASASLLRTSCKEVVSSSTPTERDTGVTPMAASDPNSRAASISTSRPRPSPTHLPIRRLELEPGKSNEIEVVYVALFPKLVLQRAGQRYTRLEASENTRPYLYESMTTDFRAELDVDGDGIVIDYPGIWERLVRGS
jgi:hypothetical protein